MSTKAGYGGKGGYGGISTMNQDQRQGYWAPHVVSKYLDRMRDMYTIKCLKCRQEWEITLTQWHVRFDAPLPKPPECDPSSASEASDPDEGATHSVGDDCPGGHATSDDIGSATLRELPEEEDK
jgi:hypothetical protein